MTRVKARFFAGIVDQPGGLQMLDAHADQGRRDGQVIDAAARNAELLIEHFQLRLELCVGPRVVEAARHKEQGAGEIGPVALIERLGGRSG